MQDPVYGRTIVVTGATSGIGLSTATALACAEARVVLLARSPEKASAVAAQIGEATGSRNLEVVEADFASLASVRRGAADLLQLCPRIDVLVNNAGILNTSRRETVDGFEETFAVNHLAPFLLTELLRERMAASGTREEPARIVNVASEAHRFAALCMEDLDSRGAYSAMKVYGMSKQANILWTYELARRLQEEPVVANCLHPGAVRTGLGRNNAPAWVGKFVYGLLAPFLRSGDRGARTSVYLATNANVRRKSGLYFKDYRPVKSHAQTYDVELQAALWKECARRVGL